MSVPSADLLRSRISKRSLQSHRVGLCPLRSFANDVFEIFLLVLCSEAESSDSAIGSFRVQIRDLVTQAISSVDPLDPALTDISGTR